MRKNIFAIALMTLMAVLLAPARTDAYGAAHVGYTRVTPNGVYHTGRTEVAGPGGVYSTGRTTAAGPGGEYRAGYGAGYGPAGYNKYGTAAAYGVQAGYGAAIDSHVYAPGYYGGYGYIR